MSPDTPDIPERTTEQRRRASRRGGFQPRAVIAIAVAWLFLWDRISWGNIVNGLIIGLVVTLAFPLPPIEFAGRLRPVRFAYLVFRFFTDLVVASIQVTRLAFSRAQPRNAVIEVPLRTQSDLYLTITAELNALVPGSVVLDADRSTSTLYLHLLDVGRHGAIEAGRADVYRVEERVVRALGSDEEIAAITGGRREDEAR